MKGIAVTIIAIVLIVLGIVLLGGNGGGSIENGDSIAKSDFDKAPDFTLKNYEGEEVSLSDFDDKKVKIVNSWAVWCPFCRDELPDFVEAKEEFGDEVAVIAIDRAESLEKAKGFTDSIGVTEGLVFLLDPEDSFYRSIGGFSMPETLFLDRENNIIIHKRGPMNAEEIKDKIRQVLEK